MRAQTLSEMISALEHGVKLDSEVQIEARNAQVCPCCGSDKHFGHLLCPKCYAVETPTGLIPFKYSGMTFSAWIEQSRAELPKGWRVITS